MLLLFTTRAAQCASVAATEILVSATASAAVELHLAWVEAAALISVVHRDEHLSAFLALLLAHLAALKLV